MLSLQPLFVCLAWHLPPPIRRRSCRIPENNHSSGSSKERTTTLKKSKDPYAGYAEIRHAAGPRSFFLSFNERRGKHMSIRKGAKR